MVLSWGATVTCMFRESPRSKVPCKIRGSWKWIASQSSQANAAGNYSQTSEGILRVYATPTPSSQPLQITARRRWEGRSLWPFRLGPRSRTTSRNVISTTQGIDGAFDNFAVEQPLRKTQICVDQINGQFVLTYKSGRSTLGDYHRDGVINARMWMRSFNT